MKRLIMIMTMLICCLLFASLASAEDDQNYNVPMPGTQGENATQGIVPGSSGTKSTSAPTKAPSNSSGSSSSGDATATDAPSGGTVEPREDGMEAPDSGSVSDGAAATAAPEQESVSSENTHPSAEPAASEASVATNVPSATEAPASVPEAQTAVQNGMPVWGIVLIAVGAAAVGAAIVFLIMRKR